MMRGEWQLAYVDKMLAWCLRLIAWTNLDQPIFVHRQE